ncbi:hypothetical protein VNO78_25729 [Psophocarpus tetragonolobus]|uniref:Uncharacterized protein n=1 Tax=Psophocarpus tetragonolobus TaxID=3891 RepID=A0AAN9S6E5_PSOTE
MKIEAAIVDRILFRPQGIPVEAEEREEETAIIESQMQSKITNFFNSASDSASASGTNGDDKDNLFIWENQQHHIINTYARRREKANVVVHSHPKPVTVVKNKKRSYAQFHLDFGQSDFLLRACSTCGIKFTPGDPHDEKSHNEFHKSYTQGIPFKGWTKENVIPLPSAQSGRVVLVSENRSSSHTKKVEEVVRMMEIELGSEWILHDLCKVYLFVSLHKVVGWLVAEPIHKAFKVVSAGHADSVKKKTRSTTLQFGNVIFQREVGKKIASPTDSERMEGALFCDTKPTAASCGIRAIWVTPSNRRKGIATQLLDAVRKSFCTGLEFERTQLAFSQPTSAGKALATRYTGTGSFLAKGELDDGTKIAVKRMEAAVISSKALDEFQLRLRFYRKSTTGILCLLWGIPWKTEICLYKTGSHHPNLSPALQAAAVLFCQVLNTKIHHLGFWFLNKEFVRVASFSDHEAFDHPVICLLAVSSKDEQPINRFITDAPPTPIQDVRCFLNIDDINEVYCFCYLHCC